MNAKKLIDRLEQIRKEKPFRYLGRRVLQTMTETATANLVIGRRTAPGRYLAVRLVEDGAEKSRWEDQFAESRDALLREVEREAAARGVHPKSALELELIVLTDAEAAAGESNRLLATVLEPAAVAAAAERLRDEREIILPRASRMLLLESDPSEAQVYVDDRPYGVTPCRIDDIAEGEHAIALSKPGYLLHEEKLRVHASRPGERQVHRVPMRPEPAMGVLEIRTFPPGAQVTIGPETRDAPSRWRLPAGPVTLEIAMRGFEPTTIATDLPPSPEHRPHKVQIRLDYAGPDRDEVVGRLIVYRADSNGSSEPAEPAASNRISDFFRQVDDTEQTEVIETHRSRPAEILGERPLKRGVLLIGREDPDGDLTPDVRLYDPENSVSRGCHAWLWVYTDTSTGAEFNTFLIGNNSSAGIRVDGETVMETRRLSDDSEIEIGGFRMRLAKSLGRPRVEFGF